MRLVKLTVTNYLGAVLEFPLDDISGGFVVKEIEGLGPVKASLVSSRFAGMDGAQFHSARRDPRNLLIKLGLDPDFNGATAFDLRSQLYSFLMPKSEATFKFYFPNNVVREIKGVVESNEADIFSKDPGVVISAMCYDPDFLSLSVTGFVDQPANAAEYEFTYSGSVPTGVHFSYYPGGNTNDFTVYHRRPDNKVYELKLNYPMTTATSITVVTIPGKKSVLVNGDPKLWSVTSGSVWMMLYPGVNKIRVQALSSTATEVPGLFEMSWFTRYGGL